MNRKYKLNEDYFRVLETSEQAYILGFIYADGYNREGNLKHSMITCIKTLIYTVKRSLTNLIPYFVLR